MKKEKLYELILFIIIFLAVLSILSLRPLNDLDEIWNYNFARNISNGLIPYKDFNILQMPLLPIICGIILKFTINKLIIMRILGAILCSTIIYITYKIFKLMEIRKEVSIIFTFFIGYLFRDIFCIDYNYLTLLITLIIIYVEISLYKKYHELIKINKKQDLILGILAGLAILTKQTTGILITIVLLGNKLVFVREKEHIKVWVKSFLYRLSGIMIPLILFILYLIINNAISEFVSYTILGILEFDNKISYRTLINLNFVGILSVFVPITIIYEWIKTICLEKDKNLYLVLVYGIAIFAVCFPISNKIHFLIGGLPIIILTFYELYLLIRIINNKINKFNKVKLFVLIMLNSMLVMWSIYYSISNFYDYFEKRENYSNLKHFEYIPIDKGLENQINNITKYIKKENNVKILDSSAAVYMIPLNRYNKNYDMLLKGNLGYEGEEKLIKEILELEDYQFLVLNNNYIKNWQTPLNIIDCIVNNKTKIGEIEIFDIYK